MIFANALHTRNFHESLKISGPALGRWQYSLREHRPVDTADSWWPAPRTSRRSVSDTPVHAKLMIAKKKIETMSTDCGQSLDEERERKKEKHLENQKTYENMLSPLIKNSAFKTWQNHTSTDQGPSSCLLVRHWRVRCDNKSVPEGKVRRK